MLSLIPFTSIKSKISYQCSTISREEIEDNKSSQDITKSVNVDKLNKNHKTAIDIRSLLQNYKCLTEMNLRPSGSSSRKGYQLLIIS